MALERDFTEADRLFLGDDIRVLFTVYDQTGLTDDELLAQIAASTATPVDVSGWALAFALRKKDNSADPILIEKTTGSPGGILVIGTWNASQSVNTQQVQVTIDDTDSYDPGSPGQLLKKGTYRYAVKRMDDGSEKVLVFGKWPFMQATTR